VPNQHEWAEWSGVVSDHKTGRVVRVRRSGPLLRRGTSGPAHSRDRAAPASGLDRSKGIQSASDLAAWSSIGHQLRRIDVSTRGPSGRKQTAGPFAREHGAPTTRPMAFCLEEAKTR